MVNAEYGEKLVKMEERWRLYFFFCRICHPFLVFSWLWCASQAWRSLTATALIRGTQFVVTLCCIHLSHRKELDPLIWTNQFLLFSDISAHCRFTALSGHHWCLTAPISIGHCVLTLFGTQQGDVKLCRTSNTVLWEKKVYYCKYWVLQSFSAWSRYCHMESGQQAGPWRHPQPYLG